MKWLATHYTTILMAIILSLVTVGLLATPSEVDTFILTAEFRPQVRAEVGSLEYKVEGKAVTDFIPVTVTANRNDITGGFRLVCQPILDQSKFPSDVTLRETQVEITPKDFTLPPDTMRRIRIENFTVLVRFAPMTTKELPIQVSAQDILDAKDARYRVEAVRAIPPVIRVRLPFDKAQTITSLPVRPIRIAGRTESFSTEGLINTDLADDYRDVRRLENFTVQVDLRLIEARREVEGIPLLLAAPVMSGLRAELIDAMTFKVEISGSQDIVKVLSYRPDLIMVYVLLDRNLWKEGTHQVPVKCDVPEEFRKEVTVKLAPGERAVASVRVIRS